MVTDGRHLVGAASPKVPDKECSNPSESAFHALCESAPPTGPLLLFLKKGSVVFLIPLMALTMFIVQAHYISSQSGIPFISYLA